jgi:8-oxo-dGTP pyrophosphatase MutT (NUDIX family)
MYIATRLRRPHCFVDIWFTKADFNISDCVLQKEEVDDVKWVSAADLIKLVFEAEYRDDDYKAIIEKELERLSVRDGI